jgi:hypothetical protein
MNLLNLAPDIQEEVLGLDTSAATPIRAEKQIRSITKIVPWNGQRSAWTEARNCRTS